MTTIIAELGSNHEGDPDKACAMIREAALCGVDGVKVQSFLASDFLRPDDPDYDQTERCEIWPFLPDLAEVAHREKLLFGVTPQVKRGVQDAVQSGADYLKVASECILQHGLIRACLESGLPTWVSTGMATREEIRAVPAGAKLMLCTSLYPCPPEEAHLRRFIWAFRGFSDHTEGVEAACVAAFVGVEMIEKHFCLSKEGYFEPSSADPDEMRRYVEAVRKVELMRGSVAIKPPSSRNLIPEGQLRT